MKIRKAWIGLNGVQIFASFVVAVVFLCSAAVAAESDAVTGKWWDEKKESQLEIFKCADKYCGKVAFLKEPNYSPNDKGGMAGKPKIDRENPNPALRTTPVLGLKMMQDFKYAGDNVWDGGTIYVAEDGKTYKCKLTLENPDRLKVRGYIGVPMLGKTTYWSRVK